MKNLSFFIISFLITASVNAQNIRKSFTSASSSCNTAEITKVKKTPYKKITAHTAAEGIIPEKWIKKFIPCH